MEKLQEVELRIEDLKQDGVFAISLVDKPAIQEDFIYLESHEINLKVTNEEKRLVTGLALIPNKRIYRAMKGKEFNIYFNDDTIRLASQMYMENLNLNNVTIDHEQKVNGVSVVESWIVEDEKNDKSNVYNLNATKGSWVVTMKVHNDEVWQDIKDGKYKGFSIEAMFSGLESLFSNQIELSDDEKLINEIKDLLKNA